jgi:hypothetical protein
MGHPRLGEMMSRQRLCGDVLLAHLMGCRPFVFVKFYRSPVAPRKAPERAWHTRRAARQPPGEHYLQNNLNVLHDTRDDCIVL